MIHAFLNRFRSPAADDALPGDFVRRAGVRGTGIVESIQGDHAGGAAACAPPWRQGARAMSIIASPRHASSRCLDNIKSFEGCELAAYPDPGSGSDPWTIGWGSTGADIHKGLVWTQQQCDDRLAADVQCFALGVDKLIGPASTTQSEFDAMVSFAYNVGLGNLASSTLLKLHKAGRHTEAALQFVRWNKAGGQVMRGLTRRREAEADLYRSAP